MLSELVAIQKSRLQGIGGDTLPVHCALGVTPTLFTAPRWHGGGMHLDQCSCRRRSQRDQELTYRNADAQRDHAHLPLAGCKILKKTAGKGQQRWGLEWKPVYCKGLGRSQDGGSVTGLLVHGGPQHATGKPPSMVSMEQAGSGRSP